MIADVVHAPFIYFDDAPVFGLVRGVVTVTLSAQRSLISRNDEITSEQVAVVHLRCGAIAARALRDALDKVLLASMPVEHGAEGATKN